MTNRNEITLNKLWEIKDKELLNLIIGREGGETTTLIIDKILAEPYNKNQLSNTLKLDYNTITHHHKIMKNHDYVMEIKFENIKFYHPSDKLIKSLKEYYIIKEHMKKQ